MIRRLNALILLATLVGSALPFVLKAETPLTQRRDTTQDTLIKNATVLTVSHGTLQNTDILIRKGKIVAVGKNLKASENVHVVDATGKWVMPGIIDCHSHSMLDAINELTYSVTSMARTRDVLDPGDISIYRELAEELRRQTCCMVQVMRSADRTQS